MEPQLHHAHGTDVHGGETKSTMKKVKEKVEKLKDKIKHGHGDHGGEEHRDDAETVNNSPVVRSGLVEPTVMGTPVLAEDLHATHSDIVDPPVRSFAQWEEEERHGDPPPLSTGLYGTQLTDLSHIGQDVNKEQSRGIIGKSTGMEEDPNAPNRTTAASPANYQSKVTDPTSTGGKEAGITEVLRSFNKMGVYDEPEPATESIKPDEDEPKLYGGTHDQFLPEPVANPPLDTIAEDPSHRNSSYRQKVSSATSAIADKAMAAKDLIVSKLSPSGENKDERKPSSSPTDYAHKVADTVTGKLSPIYEKVVGAGSPVTVKEYLVEAFKPGDDDKVLSEVITHAFHRGKGNAPPQEITSTTYVIRDDQGERRLQESGN